MLIYAIFSCFMAKSWLDVHEDLGQGHRSLCATLSLILEIICVNYGNNLSRVVPAVERTRQDVQHFNCFITTPWLNSLERYRSRAQVIVGDTPFHDSDL